MVRISHYLTLATGAAVLLVQPVLAQADPVHSRHAAHRHYTAYRYHYGAAYADGYRSVPEILNEVATSPSYGTFGGYEDTVLGIALSRAGRTPLFRLWLGPRFALLTGAVRPWAWPVFGSRRAFVEGADACA